MSLDRERVRKLVYDIEIEVDPTLTQMDNLNSYRRGVMRQRVARIKQKQKDGFILTDEEQAILAFFGGLNLDKVGID